MTVIKNMEEYGRAFDAGDDLQTQTLDGDWKDGDMNGFYPSGIRVFIRDGRLRIKPGTITLYEHFNFGETGWSKRADEYDPSLYTGRKIVDGVISE